MIVSDTTPISNFIQLELKDLLQQMFDMITIPEAVALELDRLRDEIHFWFTDELYRQVQYLAGDHK
jgi:predicted nucleic acid-binding protein